MQDDSKLSIAKLNAEVCVLRLLWTSVIHCMLAYLSEYALS
jgi:hypothetical protein